MQISSVRLGFACNSSSTHSLVFLPDAHDDQVSDGYFGWQFFTAASREAKTDYLAIVLESNLSQYLDGNTAQHVTRSVLGRSAPDDGHIDHQSMWTLPITRQGAGVDLDFFDDLRKYIMRDDLVILGGNDNDGTVHPLAAHSFTLNIPEDNNYRIVCRKEGDWWVLFNWDTGAKIRLSFADDPAPYKRSAYPELVDLKITNYCTGGCVWCYQDSHVRGTHADYSDLYCWIASLAKLGVFEIALGGGEPMDHPNFATLVREIREYGIVPSFTTHKIDWLGIPKQVMQIIPYIGRFACSVTHPNNVMQLAAALVLSGVPSYKASVQHVVGTVGAWRFYEILRAAAECNLNITLLGYKRVGRGQAYLPDDDAARWLEIVQRVKRECPALTVSIDTELARQYQDQLKDAGVSDILYTTQEGKFSMYIDAVGLQVGPSSYDPDRFVSYADRGNTPLDEFLVEAYNTW